MKNIFLTLALVLSTTIYGIAQDVTGKWKTIDDKSGEAKSIVEVFKKNGKVYGKVIKILDPTKQGEICKNCPGELNGKKILGMTIINDLEKNGNEYSGGTVLDPNNGKVYKCLMALEEPNILKVRGYVGISLIGRSQYWVRQEQ